MIRVPVLVPAAVGLKVTEITQLAPALTGVPQVSVWEKSPPVVMLETISEGVPLLVRLTVWAELVVPTTWLPRLMFAEDSEAIGGTGVT
jgi:hypothetical protein